MAWRYGAFALLLSMLIGTLAFGGDEPADPVKNGRGHDTHDTANADKRSCCRKLWEFVTFRHDPLPRHCQECLAYPQQSCVPPLYRFMENRFPTVTNP